MDRPLLHSEAKSVAVIGAGAAGLICARDLQKAGLRVEVFEAGDAVGGRLRTDEVAGPGGTYLLDRGFQVLLEAYPEVRHQLDRTKLSLQAFAPGAVLACGAGDLRIVADPSRSPRYLLRTLLARIASLADVWRLLKLRLRHVVLEGPYDTLERLRVVSAKGVSTKLYLESLHLSPSIIDRFLRPFFEAIYVAPLDEQSPACFEFVLRTLADGGACLPQNGMRAVPLQLAQGLHISCNTVVREVLGAQEIRLDGGTRHFDAVVVAVDWPSATKLIPAAPQVKATRSATWYFALPSPPPVTDPLIILNSALPEGSDGDSCRVVNIGFPSVVQSSYAPPGWQLAAVTVRGPGPGTEEWLRSEVSGLLGCNVTTWQHLRTYDLPFHQPAQLPPGPTPLPERTASGVYVCGDYCEDPTLDGAMRSGHRAAMRVLSDLGLK